MTRLLCLGTAALLLLTTPGAARATGPGHRPPGLAGRLVDHTANHGADRRIWSPVLGERRDLYVYLPPGYDPGGQYPVMVWLHGINQDEQSFPRDGLRAFDAAMAAGRMPPTIVVIPDGSTRGRATLLGADTLFLNSNLGNYEDYLIQDVWGFVRAHYPIRPEREAHVISGYSGGGAAAYRIAIQYRAEFAVVFGLSSPLNPRWLDCRGRYFGNFDPDCWGWRTSARSRAVVGRFYGVIPIRLGQLVNPLYGRGPQSIEEISRDNPIEMLDRLALMPGELAMFVGYGGRDQFNVDAQVESFLYRARERGLAVEVGYAPRGRHSLTEAEKFLPQVIDWLAPQLAPFAPGACVGPAGAEVLVLPALPVE